jgi:hypothetical protein
MILGHRKIWIWLDSHLKKTQSDECKLIISMEMHYLDAIEMFIHNDLVLKLHGLLEVRAGHDSLLNERFGLSETESVCNSLREIFNLEVLFQIRNRYVAHLDADHNGRRKNHNSLGSEDLAREFSQMLTMENIEFAINQFSLIFNILEGQKENTIEEIIKAGDRFWERYRLGIMLKTGIQ